MNYPRWWILPRGTSTKMVKHTHRDCRSIERADATPIQQSEIKLNGIYTVCRFCSGEYQPADGNGFEYYRQAVDADP